MHDPGRIPALISRMLCCIGCAITAYAWRDMQCGIDHLGYSAPAAMSLLQGLPFAIAALLCTLLAIRLRKLNR